MENYCNKNICFYYYGEDHLVLNLYKYIKGEIEDNNYVFLFCDDNIYNLLTMSLNSNEKSMVGKIEIDKIILKEIFKKNSINYDHIEKIKTSVLDKGFWGINIIMDLSYLIKSIGEANVLEYIKNLSNICHKDKVNFLTCYDFSDYLSRGKIISEYIIKSSYIYHEFRLYSNKILPMDDFNINSYLA